MGAPEDQPPDGNVSDPITSVEIAVHQRDLENAARALRSSNHPDGMFLADRLDLLRLRLGRVILQAADESEQPQPTEIEEVTGGLAVTLPWLPETHSDTAIYPGNY